MEDKADYLDDRDTESHPLLGRRTTRQTLLDYLKPRIANSERRAKDHSWEYARSVSGRHPDAESLALAREEIVRHSVLTEVLHRLGDQDDVAELDAHYKDCGPPRYAIRDIVRKLEGAHLILEVTRSAGCDSWCIRKHSICFFDSGLPSQNFSNGSNIGSFCDRRTIPVILEGLLGNQGFYYFNSVGQQLPLKVLTQKEVTDDGPSEDRTNPDLPHPG